MKKTLLKLSFIAAALVLLVLPSASFLVQSAVPLYTVNACSVSVTIDSTCGPYTKSCSGGQFVGQLTNQSTTTQFVGCSIVGTELNDFYGRPCSCSNCGVGGYCTSTNTFFGFNDTLNPNVTALIPVTGTAFVIPQTIQIGANVVDDSFVSAVYANVTLPNGTVQRVSLTNTTGNIFNNTFTIPALFGTYTVRIVANDSVNNMNSSETTSFSLVSDVIAPTIQFVAPTEANNSFINRGNILINVTAADTNFANLTVRLYNSTGLVNQTTTVTSPNYLNVTGLADGVYTFNATAFDIASNQNSTETRRVTIDRVAPSSVVITSPTSGSTLTSLPINIAATLSEGGSCSYSLDNGVTNSTMSANSSSTGFTASPSPSNGAYTLRVYCSDFAGNRNDSASVGFTVSVSGSSGSSSSSGPREDPERGVFVIPSTDPYASTTSAVGESSALKLGQKIKSKLVGNTTLYWVLTLLLILGILVMGFLIASMMGGAGAKGKDKNKVQNKANTNRSVGAAAAGSDKKKSKK